MNWYDKNPHGSNPSFRQDMNFSVHQFARSQWASSFAQGGGFVPTAFAATGTDAFMSAMRRKHKVGSPEHIRNLEQMLAASPNNLEIKSALEKAKIAGTSKLGMLGRVGGLAAGSVFTMLPAFTTPGSGKEKARAVVSAGAGALAWTTGANFGMGTGAAIGSAIPGIGTAIGAVVGYAVGGMAAALSVEGLVDAATRVPDRLVERERSRRKLDWVGDRSAFQTDKAATMRARSMEMMNRGMMSARSMLGREAVMLHQ